jgi:hypothetical protein
LTPLGPWATPTSSVVDAVAGGHGLGGSNDLASVIDPLGTVGSTALAGAGFNSDIAAAFGDNLDAAAMTASNLVDILPTLF